MSFVQCSLQLWILFPRCRQQPRARGQAGWRLQLGPQRPPQLLPRTPGNHQRTRAAGAACGQARAALQESLPQHSSPQWVSGRRQRMLGESIAVLPAPATCFYYLCCMSTRAAQIVAAGAASQKCSCLCILRCTAECQHNWSGNQSGSSVRSCGSTQPLPAH
jgi:hypothetical protein